MAQEQDIPMGQAFSHLAHSMSLLTNRLHEQTTMFNDTITQQTEALGTQSIAVFIRPYDGTSASDYKRWIKDIEKYAYLHKCDDERTQLLAFQTGTGFVADYIKRYLESRQDKSWTELKAELASRFSDVTDTSYAFTLLSKCRQAPDQSIQMYSEEILTLANEAYETTRGNEAVLEQQLVEFFINGLYNDHIRMRIMRERPRTFERAVRSALEEQNLRKRFDLRSEFRTPSSNRRHGLGWEDGYEHMQIDHLRPSSKRACHRCGRTNHLAKDCRAKTKRVQINEVTQVAPRNSQIECWSCGEKGHIKRFCPNRGKRNYRYGTVSQEDRVRDQPLN